MMWAAHWQRIGGSVPRPKSSQGKAIKATGRGQKPNAKPAAKQPVEKAPLGSLPPESGRSAADHHYTVGDVVFWSTASAAGEYTFIGHPKGDKAGSVLALAHSAEVGFEVDADECSPTGRSDQ